MQSSPTQPKDYGCFLAFTGLVLFFGFWIGLAIWCAVTAGPSREQFNAVFGSIVQECDSMPKPSKPMAPTSQNYNWSGPILLIDEDPSYGFGPGKVKGIPSRRLAKKPEDVKTVVLMQSRDATVGEYSNSGGLASQRYIRVTLIDWTHKKVIWIDTAMGSMPPSRITWKEGESPGGGSGTSGHEAVMDCLLRHGYK